MIGFRLLATLVGRSFARAAVTLAAVAGVLGAFQILLVLVARSFRQARSFDLVTSLMPIAVQRSFGPESLTLASFPGMVTFGYFHPIVVLTVIVAGVHAATEPAGEVEWGLFDLQLARPVARHRVITRSLVLSFGLTAAVVGAMILGTSLGLVVFAPAGAPWPSPARVAGLGAHLVALAWAFAAAGLAASAWARRRATAFGAVGFAAVALYLLNFVADVWEPAAWLRRVSPFHYFPGLAVANGTAPTAQDLAVLAVPTVVLTLLAYWRFNRRDL